MNVPLQSHVYVIYTQTSMCTCI